MTPKLKKEKICILGDSLAMARPEDGIFLEDLYSSLLQSDPSNGKFWVINNSKRACTVNKELASVVDDIDGMRADVYVLQLGIVDCAPRVFSLFESRVLSVLRPVCLRRFIIKFAKKHRYFLTKHRKKSYTPIEKYKSNYIRLCKNIFEVGASKIIIINIAYPGQNLIEKSFGVLEKVESYNLVLNEVQNKFKDKIQIIDFFSATKDEAESSFMLDDGIHISRLAHQWLAEQIQQAVSSNSI